MIGFREKFTGWSKEEEADGDKTVEGDTLAILK